MKLFQILRRLRADCRVGNFLKLRLDDGFEQKEVLLDKPFEGVYISNDTWREMYDFSPDAVLLVLASEPYNEADYIRDHDAFLEFVKKKGGRA